MIRQAENCCAEWRMGKEIKKGTANDDPAFFFQMNSGLCSFPEPPVRPRYCTVIVWVAVVPLLSLTVMVAVPFTLGVIWNWVALTWVRLSWLPETLAV